MQSFRVEGDLGTLFGVERCGMNWEMLLEWQNGEIVRRKLSTYVG